MRRTGKFRDIHTHAHESETRKKFTQVDLLMQAYMMLVKPSFFPPPPRRLRSSEGGG